jgi:hypothetical protein
MANKDPILYNEYMREYMLERYRARREEAIEKLGGKCSCGETQNLQFDHIDPATKNFTIAKLPSVNEKDFWAEIDKCQLLCAPCHEHKSLVESGLQSAKDKHGTLSSFRYCKCAECKEAKAEYMREYRRKKSAGVPKKDLQHGTKVMYSYHQCRCDVCRAFNTESQREYKSRRKLKKLSVEVSTETEGREASATSSLTPTEESDRLLSTSEKDLL